jgi:hypothetical protein
LEGWPFFVPFPPIFRSDLEKRKKILRYRSIPTYLHRYIHTQRHRYIHTGVDVMITILFDFANYRRKNWPFSQIIML